VVNKQQQYVHKQNYITKTNMICS